MARPIQTAKTRRGQVQRVNQSVGLDVVAPMNVQTGAGKNAAALAKVLGIGGDLYSGFKTMDNQEQVQQGMMDAEAGAVDEEAMKNEAYYNGVSSVRAKADFITKQDELRGFLQERIDVNEATLGDVNEAIDQFYAESYGDEVDPAKLRSVVPLMSKARGNILSEYQEEIRAVETRKNQAAIYTIAQDQMKNDGTLDWGVLNEEALTVMSPSEANEMLVSIATNMAIEEGKPELLEEMPDKWPNGTPTPKHINKYDDTIRNAKQAAENQKIANENAYEKRQREALKVVREQTESGITSNILSGQDMRSQINAMVSSGRLTGEQARTLYNFNATLTDDLEEEEFEANPEFVGNLEIRLRTGQANQTDIIKAWNNGELGTDREELTRLMDVQRISTTARQSNPEIRMAQDQLKYMYPVEDDILGRQIPQTAEKQRQAQRMLFELMDQGTSWKDALKEIESTIKPYKPTDNDVSGDALRKFRSVLDGTLSPTDVTVDTARTLYDSGQITKEEYREYLQSQ